MSYTIRSSLAQKSICVLRTQLPTRSIQRTLTTLPTAHSASTITTPLKSSPKYTKLERRALGIASFTAANICVGAGLYYYISQSEGQISGSYAKKNASLDRKQYDGRADTRAMFKLNQVK